MPGADSWGDRDRALRSRIHNLDEVYLWINRTHEGINISLRFPNNEIATTSIHALLAEFRAVLLEVADRGELALDTGAPTERTMSTTRSAERR